jgi:glycine/D-amino acid oxidase-like deaminating enzyme
LFVPPGESTDILERELGAARRIGFPGVRMVERAPCGEFDSGPALQFPNQGQFHPTKYLAALARALIRNGGQIFAHTHAISMEGGRMTRVVCGNGHTISAKALVVATNTSITKALYWDTMEPYHYVRLQEDLLIAGGEDHKTGQAHDGELRFQNLEAWTRQRFPIGKVEFRWSGQVIEPVDYMAFIGPNPGDNGNVFIATGDSGQGMTHGTIAGMLLTDLITGRPNAWAKLYDPSRKPMSTLGEFARENLNVAARYRDYVTRGDARPDAPLPPDSGVVVRRGLKKIAVYADLAGNLHECSASSRKLISI